MWSIVGAASVSQAAAHSQNWQTSEQHRAHDSTTEEGGGGQRRRRWRPGRILRCGERGRERESVWVRLDDESSLGAHPSPPNSPATVALEADSKRHALPEAFLSAKCSVCQWTACSYVVRRPSAGALLPNAIYRWQPSCQTHVDHQQHVRVPAQRCLRALLSLNPAMPVRLAREPLGLQAVHGF